MAVDKNGVPIIDGTNVVISNKRNDCNFTGVVKMVDGVLKIKHTDTENEGKHSSVDTWLNAIWWANDTPENFIEVVN